MKSLDVKQHLGWIVPTLFTLCLVIYHLMYAVKAVDKIEHQLSDQLDRIRKTEQVLTEAQREYEVDIAKLYKDISTLKQYCCDEDKQNRAGRQFYLP